MNSWLDMLPNSERQKIREKYKMSAAAYEKLRQNVKGPEEMKEELAWNEKLARLRFGLETEPELKKALKKQIEKDIAQRGIEAVLSNPDIPSDIIKAIQEGNFDIDIETTSEDEPDQLALKPEGNVSEKLPITFSLTEKYISDL